MTAATLAVETNSELTAGTRSAPTSPFVGLVPFTEDHAEFFFGREKETKVIAANLQGCRLTLLYGPSGVGKSSVLWAGVFSSLRAIAQAELKSRGAPDFAVVYFNSWTTDPVEKLSDTIRKAVQASLQQKTIEPIPPTRSLVEIVKTWTNRYGLELLIILDQFEEYFLYHKNERGPGTFAHELPLVINDRDLRVRFLLSMRDDTLSRLDRFKNSIPAFDNRLQIEYLDRAAAREAIIQPVRKYNELYAKKNPYIFDHELVDLNAAGETNRKFLVDEVLEQVQVGKVTIGVTGQGTVKKEENEQAEVSKVGIEAPYLQLVMRRLWNDETTVSTHELKFETLDKLGGSQKIVEQHLDKFMEGLTEREQDLAAAMFYYLVTPSGEKIAHTVKTLAEYTKLPAAELEPLLEKLLKLSEGTEKEKEEYRILRKADRSLGKEETAAYVVYHDALGPAVLAWSEKHKKERAKRHDDARFWLWMLAVILIGLAGFALTYYRNAQQQQLEAIRAAKELERQKEEAVRRETLLFLQQEALKPYKNAILSLSVLANGSPESKAVAIRDLKHQIEANELGPDVGTAIKPLLDKVAESLRGSKAGEEAQAAANEFAKQAQDTRLSPRVYIQVQDADQIEKAKLFQQQLNSSELSNIADVRPKIIAPGIQNVGARRSVTVSELRYFHPTDLEKQIGEQLIEKLNQAGLDKVHLKLVGGYETSPNIRPNHFELWLAADVH